jgi:hypothetical protein
VAFEYDGLEMKEAAKAAYFNGHWRLGWKSQLSEYVRDCGGFGGHEAEAKPMNRTRPPCPELHRSHTGRDAYPCRFGYEPRLRISISAWSFRRVGSFQAPPHAFA